jgi:glutamyl-tRNA synthetase
MVTISYRDFLAKHLPRVKLTLSGPVPMEVKQIPKHKKNAEIGLKETTYGPAIFVEQVDALSFADNEEVFNYL